MSASNYTGMNVAGTLEVTGTSTLTGAITATGGVVGAVTGNVTGNVTGLLSSGVNFQQITGASNVTLSKSIEVVSFSSYTSAAAEVNITPVANGIVIIRVDLQNPANTITFTGTAIKWDGTNKDMTTNGNGAYGVFYFPAAAKGIKIAAGGPGSLTNVGFDNS